ncbi:aldehyde ferredoxin oxidoreductase family protein [Desulfatitalea alkaliphila]|uniref:Aldehyde ferredoxin oxidoreductase n=1 Tax=Desulfatitalea alkaliphila TaxID=2929485 RepID=A0AA41R6D0_9BACT|nr:aldehyde ferredoxin oxidoreductase C-terminal domain-containing protein [Desulfatitalea alkaliphila]MCJ8502263.1 aldehyde ferredoxin oxidoreductase [Desulfatitalea alkaliphila]
MQLIRVNMTDQSIHVEDMPSAYEGLGGRGLTSVMIDAEVPPRCDPLGPENKLILAPGLLSGTPLVNTGRISIGAKSPLTGGIKESNSGGKIATSLAKLGIAAVVVEGQAPAGALWRLVIDDQGKAALQQASDDKGARTYALCAKLLEQFGPKYTIACIGPAGELQLGSASIQTTDVDDRPCRAAARGGLGAVMGAKGLKAVVVATQGKASDTIADPEGFKEAAKAIAQGLQKNPFTGQVLPNLGTAGILGGVNAMGAFPSYNATKGVFDGWEKISGEALAERLQQRGGKTKHMGCSQCIIHCSNEYVDDKGKYVTSSLEYETLWSMGGMIGVDDLDAIARLDFLCDDIGLDTMNTGVALAVAMDAGHKPFGDGAAAIAMVEEVARGTDFGRILGSGPVAVGKHFNHHRVPAVKGQGIAAYDPRAMQGLGVTYATSTMGADHTAGNLLGLYMAGALDPLAAEGQADASRGAQVTMAALDCIGLCILAGGAVASSKGREAMLRLLGAKFGREMAPDALTEMGVRILKAEKNFNTRAGLSATDDRLPRFFHEEPLPPHNKTFLVSDDDLDKVYNFQ